MSGNTNWTKDLLLIGTVSIATFGLYKFFTNNQETEIKKEKEEKEKPQEKQISFIENWVTLSNLKEIEKYDEILQQTQDSKDLISLTFRGEALENLKKENEANEIFKYIIQQESQSNDDLYSIGRAYELLQDYENAIEIFEKLRSKNHPFAHYSLGIYLQRGVIFEKNESKAIEYFKISSDLNNPAAQYLLSLILKKGDESNKYLQKSADSNYLPALLMFGSLLLSRKENVFSFNYFMKAAIQGHPKAQFEVATFYCNGEGLAVDLDEAFEWCKKSADSGYTPAEYLLGGFYHTGSGCEKNLSKSFDYYNRASEKGNASAQYMLGSMLMTGELGIEDEELGMSLLELAANNGHESARKLFNEFSLSMILDSDEDYETDEEYNEENDK
eukprot:gene4552-7936_t